MKISVKSKDIKAKLTPVIKKVNNNNVKVVKGDKGDKGDPFKYSDFTAEQLASLKGADGKDGKTPVKGVDYFDGADGKDGSDGQDGYTPVKGVDYFDGKDGSDGTDGADGYTPVKGVDYFDGEKGDTPVKGVDYFTQSDVETIVRAVQAGIVVPTKLSDLTADSGHRTVSDSEKSTWSGKQSAISDLDTIRSGAALGATSLQSFTETDPTVPSWAKASNKPTYTAAEVHALPDSTIIPAAVTDAHINELIDAKLGVIENAAY